MTATAIMLGANVALLKEWRAMNCPYCNKEAIWTENKAIYGKNYGRSYMSYYCKPCDAYVGCHNNTRKPLGTMANAETREARKLAHLLFDPLWKNGIMSRDKAYKKLSNHFGKEIHIGESDIKTCQEICVFLTIGQKL